MTYSGGIPSGSKNANDPLATGSFSSDPGQDVFPANVFPPATASSDYSLYSSNGPTIVSNIFAHYNIPKSVDQLPFGFGEGIKTIRNRPSGSAHACSKNNKERKFQKKPPSGFTPADLCTGDKDYWWNPDSLSSLVVDGAAITSFSDSAQGYALTESTVVYQPTFDEEYPWSGTKTPAAVISAPSDGFLSNVIPLNLTDGSLEITYAFMAKILTDNVSNWAINTQIGNGDSAKRFGVGIKPGGVTLLYPGGNDGENVSYTVGQIVSVVIVASGGTVTLTIPGLLTTTQTYTYTPNTAPTVASTIMRAQHNSVAFGETLLLSRAISESEITQLRAYWEDKYGS